MKTIVKKTAIGMILVLLLSIIGASIFVNARTSQVTWRVTIHNVDTNGFSSAFSPQTFTASQGDVITLYFANMDYPNMDDHNVRLISPSGVPIYTTPKFDPGEAESITFTASEVGDYTFRCATGCVVMGRLVGEYAGRITVTQ